MQLSNLLRSVFVAVRTIGAFGQCWQISGNVIGKARQVNENLKDKSLDNLSVLIYIGIIYQIPYYFSFNNITELF